MYTFSPRSLLVQTVGRPGARVYPLLKRGSGVHFYSLKVWMRLTLLVEGEWKLAFEMARVCSVIFMVVSFLVDFSLPVVSDSWQPHGLRPARLLYPWNSPGKHTGVGCHFLLQGIFLTQGLNRGLLYWKAESLLSKPPFLIRNNQLNWCATFLLLIMVKLLSIW